MHDLVIIGGGQSGLAAARAALHHGLTPLVLEAGTEPVGSWPDYYDSLTVFSPADYSAMPDQVFPGDPDRYPNRDEVADYLRRYARGLDLDIRTSTRAETVEQTDAGFVVATTRGDSLETRAVVAASGSFGNPWRPRFAGQDDFAGRVLHVADYRNPDQLAGQRVVVVGGANSAVQVAHELASVATVTIASRQPIRFFPARPHGHDIHYWLDRSGFDTLPPSWLHRLIPAPFVMDTDGYRAALESGHPRRRPLFRHLDGDHVMWDNGDREPVDTVLLATGYRPDLGYLEPLGAVDGSPAHHDGLSTTHLGLAYVGLEFQRSFSSNTLRGVHRDADYVMAPLAAHIRDAAHAVGLR